MQYTIDAIFAAIDRSDACAANALLCLYARPDVFTEKDADILTSFARQVAENRRKAETGDPTAWANDLSWRQLEVLRRRLRHYGSELLAIANERAPKREAAPPCELCGDRERTTSFLAHHLCAECYRTVEQWETMKRDAFDWCASCGSASCGSADCCCEELDAALEQVQGAYVREGNIIRLRTNRELIAATAPPTRRRDVAPDPYGFSG